MAALAYCVYSVSDLYTLVNPLQLPICYTLHRCIVYQPQHAKACVQIGHCLTSIRSIKTHLALRKHEHQEEVNKFLKSVTELCTKQSIQSTPCLGGYLHQGARPGQAPIHE